MAMKAKTMTIRKMLAGLLLLTVAWVQTSQGRVTMPFSPVAFVLPNPPVLEGTLSPNFALYNIEKLHQGKIKGPASSVALNGNIYAITKDRLVINAASCPPKLVANLASRGCKTHEQCGQLTSIRADLNGNLLVLDAYRGLFSINPNTGAVTVLYSSRAPVGGRPPKYLNGMAVASDGTILISDSSDKFDAANDIYIIMEGRPSGRILAFNPATKRMAEVTKNIFVYPNGLELTPDGTKLLVSESGRARILSMSLANDTFMQMTPFANNLPGMPQNIRRSSRGTFWVGLANVRHGAIRNSMDIYSKNPVARKRTVDTVPGTVIKGYYPRHGLVIELDAQGKILGSLHDPTGRVMNGISEAMEQEGLLYISSPDSNFVGRIVLPQGDGRVVTVDSVLQTLRSRCQISDQNMERAKQILLQYLAKQAGQGQGQGQGQGGGQAPAQGQGGQAGTGGQIGGQTGAVGGAQAPSNNNPL